MSTKQSRGAPTKEQRQKNIKAKTENKLVGEIIKGEALIVDNYAASIELLIKAMKGEVKGVSPTNQLSSAKIIKAWGDEIMEKMQGDEDEDVTPREVPIDVKPTAPLISLVAEG